MKIFSDGLNGVVQTAINKSPLYVQYYITARCNLRCEQCNVIYANADLNEANTLVAKKAINNLGNLGTKVILLTGGEPFVRNDLAELVEEAIKNNIHPRLQTNGLATFEKLSKCVNAGANDISISLDSLDHNRQDFLNGQYTNSWDVAIQTISNVNEIFPEKSFCAIGCVFSPYNYLEVINVIKFASEIGWYVSLVPAHTSTYLNPRSFSTFDNRLRFAKEQLKRACEIIDEIIRMKKEGYKVYDSITFLENMKLFISGQKMDWRNKNDGRCDATKYYFAVLPDTSFSICCDYRYTAEHVLVSDKEFINKYKSGELTDSSKKILNSCTGCLYGSYPEITISARYVDSIIERIPEFLVNRNESIKKIGFNKLQDLAMKIQNANK